MLDAVHLLRVIAISNCFVCIYAPSFCVKKGACRNVANGSQERPVLSGNQQHVNSDGTCKYGHASVEGRCKAGWDCGYTWFECRCIDESAAVDGQGGDADLKLWGGVFSILLGAGLLLGLGIVEMNRSKKSGQTVAPYMSPTGGPAKNASSPSSTPGFADIFGNPKQTQVNHGPANGSENKYGTPFRPASQECDIDGCGLMCVVLLLSVILIGIVLIVLSLSADRHSYFNECESA